MTPTPFPLRLSLGPVSYCWSRQQLFDFYAEIVRTPVDIVYLGEIVCAKRRVLRNAEWMEIAQWLQTAGKQVVLSTLTLIEAESELHSVARICNNKEFLVEANDMAAVGLLSGRRPFVTGPGVNIYNTRTLDLLASLGLKRWVMPVELGRDTLADMQAQRPEGVETEVVVYGRLPLAYSARCFTARAHNLPKDDCRFRCRDHTDGLPLATRDGDPFLVLNGIQTQSARTLNLLGVLEELVQLKVDVLRISPQSQHTPEIIARFDACRSGARTAAQAGSGLEGLMPVGPCDGYWYGKAGMESAAAAGGIP